MSLSSTIPWATIPGSCSSGSSASRPAANSGRFLRGAATVAQKLVDAKVNGVVGHLNSGTTIPASAIYNQAGIPMISGSATNPKLTEQGFKNVFRVVGRDDQQGPAIASYLASERKPKVVAVIDDATAYGEGIANEVEKTLKAANIKVLPRE